MLAYGINREVKRDILAIEPMYEEPEETRCEFFRKMRKSRLWRLCFCIYDGHQDIQTAECIGSSR